MNHFTIERHARERKARRAKLIKAIVGETLTILMITGIAVILWVVTP